jgi:hypothetical protein
MDGKDVDSRIAANTALAVVWSFLRAVSYAFLLVGVYVGRKSVVVAPVATPPQMHS